MHFVEEITLNKLLILMSAMDLLENSMRKVVDVHAMTSYKSGVAKTWVYIILLDLYNL